MQRFQQQIKTKTVPLFIIKRVLKILQAVLNDDINNLYGLWFRLVFYRDVLFLQKLDILSLFFLLQLTNSLHDFQEHFRFLVFLENLEKLLELNTRLRRAELISYLILYRYLYQLLVLDQSLYN